MNVEIFGDDSVLEPYFPIRRTAAIKPFGLSVTVEHGSGDLGHHFFEYIHDLHDDFGKLQKSEFLFDADYFDRLRDECDSVFGDILPVRFVGSGLYVCLTQDLVHIMSMETMLLSMYDYPELFWHLLSRFTNLRRISISPWCDEQMMGQALRGKRIVYHRKPSPNFLGVGDKLDEEGLRAHIRQTVDCARGCTLEFTQRDVYTVHGSTQKVARYVEILREETQDCYEK